MQCNWTKDSRVPRLKMSTYILHNKKQYHWYVGFNKVEETVIFLFIFFDSKQIIFSSIELSLLPPDSDKKIAYARRTNRQSNSNTQQCNSVCSSTQIHLSGICESPILSCSKGRTYEQHMLKLLFFQTKKQSTLAQIVYLIAAR